MRKITISTLLMLLCAVAFGQKVEGTWTTTLESENGSYTFYAEYEIKGDTAITGRLYSVDGSVDIYKGKIKGNEFEYFFDLNYNQIKHAGKLVDGELKITSSSDNGEMEFTMTRAKEE